MPRRSGSSAPGRLHALHGRPENPVRAPRDTVIEIHLAHGGAAQDLNAAAGHRPTRACLLRPSLAILVELLTDMVNRLGLARVPVLDLGVLVGRKEDGGVGVFPGSQKQATRDGKSRLRAGNATSRSP